MGALRPDWALSPEFLVHLPDGGPVAMFGELRWPDMSVWRQGDVYSTALVIAVIASIETLLCVEAIDKLDPRNRVTPANRELVAQGIGNVLAGLVGGIPMTAVVVRGSANVQAGATSRVSAFLHGVLLLVTVLTAPALLNMIPLASLAAVLIFVGYKLTPAELRRLC